MSKAEPQLEGNVGRTGMVLYTDASTRPNPGYGGYGIYGYTFKYAVRPKNIKHPVKTALFLNHNGIAKTKTEFPIEVVDIVECVHAIENKATTNNYSELRATIEGLRLATEREILHELIVLTDSSYVVSSFNESLNKWFRNGWVKQDGQPISHLADWQQALTYRETLKAKGVKITFQWVKGHSEDYGNEVCDLYSVIASNAARLQHEEGVETFVTDIYSKQSSYQEYKKSYDNKDFVYHFKDLFFNSQTIDDTSYCFITDTEDDSTKGRRATDSIFLAVKGYVPPLVNRLKEFYRALPRNYVCTCCIKLTGLENRDVLRIADYVDVKYLLRRKLPNRNIYTFIRSDSAFMEENTMEFPFIMNINKLSCAMENIEEGGLGTIAEDITQDIIGDGKVILTGKDRYIDLDHRLSGRVQFTQKLLLGVGLDIPNYLALKKLEDEIRKVDLVLHKDPESNFYTVFTKLTTDNREVYSVNVPNKFLAFKPAV